MAAPQERRTLADCSSLREMETLWAGRADELLNAGKVKAIECRPGAADAAAVSKPSGALQSSEVCARVISDRRRSVARLQGGTGSHVAFAAGRLARDFLDAGAERVPRVGDQTDFGVTLKARVR